MSLCAPSTSEMGPLGLVSILDWRFGAVLLMWATAAAFGLNMTAHSPSLNGCVNRRASRVRWSTAHSLRPSRRVLGRNMRSPSVPGDPGSPITTTAAREDNV